MKTTNWLRGASIALLASALLGTSLPAAATLGGDAASVAADAQRLEGSVQTSAGSAFTLYQISLPSGTAVNEYVAPTGTVFAVSWQGPSLPDLRQILGPGYFSQYLAAAQTDGGGRLVQLPGLVVQSGGRMRAFAGRAYLPQLLPAGVAVSDIK